MDANNPTTGARGITVQSLRGYVIRQWSGPNVDTGITKPFSAEPRGAWANKYFDTLEQAIAWVNSEPPLRVAHVEFSIYVPSVPRPVVGDGSEVCENCDAVIRLNADGKWVETREVEEDEDCPDGPGKTEESTRCHPNIPHLEDEHAPPPYPTDEQVEQWIEFELVGGSLSKENPLIHHSLMDGFDVEVDVEEV
jgi:hypothetical protein